MDIELIASLEIENRMLNRHKGELIEKVWSLEAENERLRKALEFYADAQSYEYEILDVKEDGTELCHEPTVIFDDGKRAREALQNG